MTTTVRLSYFSRSVVLAIGEELGIFERYGISVEAAPVTSSPHQFGLILEGACDVAFTNPDNVLAYALSSDNPLGRLLDVRMLLGLDGGLGLSVMGRPGLASLGQLRGGRVGVDVPQSGFALALVAVLASAGLEPGTDYELVTLGATPRRREALLQGACDATLLNAGHDLAAEAAGCERLARITDHYRPYLGAVMAATPRWLDENESEARRFAVAWLEAVGVALDRSRDARILATVERALGLGAEAAPAFLEVLRSPVDGLVADGVVDRAGLATVGGLRGVEPASAERLIDDRLVPRVPA